MHRDDTGQLALAVRVQGQDRLGGGPVQGPAVLLQERAVGGLLDESMAEEVFELRLQRHDVDQPAGLEGAQLGACGHVALASSRRSRIVTPNWRPITEATRKVRLHSCGSLSIRASSRP